MAAVEKFEDLKVWQQARELNRLVHTATKSLKDYSFTDQIRRAALSVMNHIAEGFERRTDSDFGHFLDVAKASAGEVRSMTYAAEDFGYFDAPTITQMRQQSKELGAGLGAFSQYLRRPKSK